ncbi:pyridoxal 5'-phosphate synthase [Streptomyces sp. NPDC057245]|uniref:pyridoxine/pyridoxamine 5'-phosphate oxidase n=1 Tax=Streptomyces TaxID=1883 RepID=UPI0027E3BE86|nr:pyridoxal 5'-phosphate synthase [Streptomyces sp. A108]
MRSLDEHLRSLRVWDPAVTDLPPFDPADAPGDPLALFTQWFGETVAAGQSEPHTVSLATADSEGLPDVRVVMLHGADADGWSFATHADSRKGRHLAARPYAALLFYWPVLGRQVRLRGPVTVAPAEDAQADLHARSAGALAAALTGRQSAELGSVAELARASEAAWERAGREPDAPVPTWTLYRLLPEEVEFFQGDARRRHVRLAYRRPRGDVPVHGGADGPEDGGRDGRAGRAGRDGHAGRGWERRLLWP